VSVPDPPPTDAQQQAFSTLLSVTQSNANVIVAPNVLGTDVLGMQPPTATGSLAELQTPQNVALLRAQLINGWTPTDATSINTASNQYERIMGWSYLLPSNWASSGSSIEFQLPANEARRQGWQTLFASYQTILSQVEVARAPYIYSRNDFWHGHLAFSGAHQTWFVLFHAAEYPQDLEEYKDGYAQIVDGPPLGVYRSISSDSDYYMVRNGIYTFADDTLRVLYFRQQNFNTNPYLSLLGMYQQAVAVSDDYLFDVDTTLTASLNWFSAENVPLFLH